MKLEIVTGAIECDNCHPSQFSAIKHDGVIRCSNCGVEATPGHGANWTKIRSARYGMVFAALIFIAFGYLNLHEVLPSPASFFGKTFMIMGLYGFAPIGIGYLIGRFIAKNRAQSADVLSCKKINPH